jgi:hypothetical protein
MYPLESRQNKTKRKTAADNRASIQAQSLKNERLVRRIRESEPAYFFILTAKGERILKEFEGRKNDGTEQKDVGTTTNREPLFLN